MAEVHFKELCKFCNKVISQCRCIEPNKEIRYGICSDCNKTIVENKVAEK